MFDPLEFKGNLHLIMHQCFIVHIDILCSYVFMPLLLYTHVLYIEMIYKDICYSFFPSLTYYLEQ